MKIDYIVPNAPADWEANAYIEAFRAQGVLNRAYKVEPEAADQLMVLLRASTADILIFHGADQHMAWLHCDPRYAEIIRSLPQRKLCICGEPILANRIPWAKARSTAALACYDIFGFTYEADAPFFAELQGQGRASLCLFAVDETLFRSETVIADRMNRVLFTGKFTDFGLTQHGVYGLRRAIGAFLQQTKIADIHYTAGLDDFVALMNRYRHYIVLPGLGEVNDGLSRKAFEVMAAGCLLLHPRQGAGSVTSSLFAEGRDCIYYDPTDQSDIARAIAKVESMSAEDVAQCAMSARNRVLEGHTVRNRARQIIAFATEGRPING